MIGRKFILGLVLALGVSGAGYAAAWRFSPIVTEIPANQRAAAITLKNDDRVPLNYQLRLYKWTQADNADQYADAADMLVSPPAVTIQPGQSYQVRLSRRAVSPLASEQSYRLFIDQLPPPRDPNNSLGVSMIMRAALPVFVTDRKFAVQLSWRLRQDASGLYLGVTNSGTKRVRLGWLTLQPEGQAPIAFGDALIGYVLAGAEREFKLKPAEGTKIPVLTKGTRVALTANDSSQRNPITATVTIQ